MTNAGRDNAVCEATLAALAHGGEATDWPAVEKHLATCPGCGAGLDRLTLAIAEQFSASRLLDGAVSGESPASVLADASTAPAADAPISHQPATGQRPRVLPFAGRTGRRLIELGLAAAALVAACLVAVVVVQSRAGSTGRPGAVGKAEADRRPEFVPELTVSPPRANNTYRAGDLITVCLRINQPSHIVLSVLEGKATFPLYDADSDPGSHCFPEQVTNLRSRATLRVDVFYGAERVAREDITLLPAAPPAAP